MSNFIYNLIMMTLLRSAIKKANPNFKSSWLLPLDKHYNFQYQEY